jgi:hypothetical protein
MVDTFDLNNNQDEYIFYTWKHGMNYVLVVEEKFSWDSNVNFVYCCKLKVVS